MAMAKQQRRRTGRGGAVRGGRFGRAVWGSGAMHKLIRLCVSAVETARLKPHETGGGYGGFFETLTYCNSGAS